MEHELILLLQNTSEEYRKYAHSLMDIFEYFLQFKNDPKVNDRTVDETAYSLEDQIRELTLMAEAMQNSAETYRELNRNLSDMEIQFGRDEHEFGFGTSEFANLSEHEKLMPIHMQQS